MKIITDQHQKIQTHQATLMNMDAPNNAENPDDSRVILKNSDALRVEQCQQIHTCRAMPNNTDDRGEMPKNFRFSESRVMPMDKNMPINADKYIQ